MECLRSSVFSDEKEFRRYRRNWINLFITMSLTGMCYLIVIPSLHQFVTSNKNPVDSSVSGVRDNEYLWK